jgi:hypothetical protein
MKLEELFGGDLNGLMEQAQQVQKQMKEAQDRAANKKVTGEAGGGLVKVVANGRQEILSVEIDHAVIGEDREMLQDLFVAATNDALRKSKAMMGEELGPLADALKGSGMDL